MVIVILLLVTLIITLPLFLSNSLILSQDILWHFVWSEQFQKALMEGALYPRWVETPFGYGSPTFIFYAPLTFYVISLINILTNSILLSMKIAICLSFFLSGLSMYFLSRKLNGELAGAISGVLYQLVPYHLFDLFIRGVVPELFAFIWFPLILLFMRKIFLDKTPSTIAYMGLAYAGLILTHLASSFMFTFIMLGYGLYIAFIEKKKGLLRTFSATILGLGLSSVYLIPVVFERSFIHIEFINFFNYVDNFLFLRNNLLDTEFYPIPHGIFIIEAAFLAFSFLLIRKKIIDNKNVFFVLLLFISLFLTVPLSSLLWHHIPEFSNLQFPWRWLMFSGFSVAVLAGTIVGNFKGEIRKSAGIFFLPMLILSLLTILQVSFFAKEEIDKWTKDSVVFAPIEYRPVWLQHHRKKLPPTERLTIVRGSGSADIIEWTSQRRVLLSNGMTPLLLKFSTFYFPGWAATIDGKKNEIIIDKVSGSIVIEVPAGHHEIQLYFGDTPVRHYGKVISIVALFLVILISLHEIFIRKSRVTQ